MSIFLRHLSLNSPDMSAQYAVHLGDVLQPGDTVLLTGDIGSGKTHIARHLIQSLMDAPEDVPSPTFTLIQTYETRKGLIQHADLYRLHDQNEIVELGLLDAFGTDICLIEWPDRLGDLTPPEALSISMTVGRDTEKREMVLTCDNENLAQRLKGLHNG